MSTLLVELKGNRTFNRSIFRPKLFVYDDLLIYQRRKWFTVREVTISYNQIAQVILYRVIIFGGMQITTNGPDIIRIKFVSKQKAIRAKKIIDQKIYHSHSKHKPSETDRKSRMHNYEKSLARLKELVERGKITRGEYNRKRNALLKDIR